MEGICGNAAMLHVMWKLKQNKERSFIKFNS